MKSPLCAKAHRSLCGAMHRRQRIICAVLVLCERRMQVKAGSADAAVEVRNEAI